MIAALTLSYSKVSDFLSSAVPSLVARSALGNVPVPALLIHKWGKLHQEYLAV